MDLENKQRWLWLVRARVRVLANSLAQMWQSHYTEP